MGEVG